MKTILLMLVFASISMQGQTTYDLNWEMGIGTDIDLTINTGDKVRWTWTDDFTHTVQSMAGSTQSFNSGAKTGYGSTYTFTFTVVGTNPYYCGYHPATMAGTITVQNPLSVEEFSLKDFSILPNPTSSKLNLKIPNGINIDGILIFDLLGNQVISMNKIQNPIDISNLTMGMYFLKISSENLSYTKRFIKL